MRITRRKFIHSAVAAAAFALWQEREQKAQAAAVEPATYADPVTGPFKPSWDSLQNYQCPDWFRDAKFGIWAHWDAQCVPEQGSWYARDMYQQGSNDYEYHCKTYGHPSKVGFKDIDHLWKAENWDPEHLTGLYKAAGAKYFVALANHHDNLDCYDSKHQPWNTTKVGPMKDIVGIWAKAARKAGMRFGVSNHASRPWSWMEPSQGADATGPLAGVPYDGHLTKADGKGQWWEGLDPQDLYAQNHKLMGGDFDYWQNRLNGDLPSAAYREKFYNRTIDLVDTYHPDLLYFDDYVMPLYNVDPALGLGIAAHHYNASIKRNGKLQAIMNCKRLDAQQEKCLIQDYERGASDVIRPRPWQTDTCIGNWFYNRSVFENHAYKTPDQVIKTLMDIVSKNGNLLLSIPLRGDGTPDSDEIAFLQGMAAWMNVNQEAIFSTRPWKVYGEGPVKVPGGGYNEAVHPYSSKDIRFTTKGSVLYATALGWPDDGKLTVRTLSSATTGLVGSITTVSLIGSPEKPAYTQTADGLVVTMPAQKPCDHAYVLKIEGLDLAASMPVLPPPPPVRAAADGTLTLSPFDAEMHGKIQAQTGDVPNIGYWDNAADTASWNVHFDAPGTYAVATSATSANGATAFVVDAGAGASAAITVPKTDGWYSYEKVSGILKVASAGDHLVTVRAADPATWNPMNLASVTLTRTGN